MSARAMLVVACLIVAANAHAVDPSVRARLKDAVMALGKMDVFSEPVTLEVWDSGRYLRVLRNEQEIADVVAIGDNQMKAAVRGRQLERRAASAATKAVVAALLFEFESNHIADGYYISCGFSPCLRAPLL